MGLWKEGPNLHLHPPKEQDTAEEEDTEGEGAENFLFSSQSLHRMPGSWAFTSYLPGYHLGQATITPHLED